MPRQSVHVPKYGLHKPTGQARVVLDGQSHYLGKYGSEESHRRYEQLITSWLAGHRTQPTETSPTVDFTVNELLLAYLRFAKGYFVKDGQLTSEYACIKAAVRPLAALYGDLPAADFSPLKLKSVRHKLIAADLCRGVINGHISRIKRVFRWAVENELVPPSVYHGLQAVRGLAKGRCSARETEPVKPVPDAHVDAIKAFVSPQVWVMIELQRLTGMRPGEARTLRGRHLDTTGALWEYRPAGHKTEHHGHERLVLLGPRAQAVVRPFLKADLNAFLFSPREAESARNAARRQGRKSPMTPSQRKRRPKGRTIHEFYTKDAYIRAIRRACEKAGVPHWQPNQLRHNSGTRVRKEYGLEAAQVWLGHAKADVTQIYAERNLKLARQLAAKFG